MLDFDRIKAISILSILSKYGVTGLRFNGEWGSAICPLPSHKPNDRQKTFQVNVKSNYWRCWSASCNEKAGQKGGDAINLVAILEKCSQKEAAEKLADWFNEKAAPHIEARPVKQNPQKDYQNPNAGTPQVKGFMQQTGAWLEELLAPLIPDDTIRKDLKKCLQSKIHESFLNGKAAKV